MVERGNLGSKGFGATVVLSTHSSTVISFHCIAHSHNFMLPRLCRVYQRDSPFHPILVIIHA
jgi:hypothetical protein